MRTRLKVCCIASEDEARIAIAAGADAVGLVSAMPSGPGPISDALIARIARRTPPPVATFLLSSRRSPQSLAAHAVDTSVTAVQIVDEPEPGAYEAIRAAAPHVRIVQVVHVQSDADLDGALRVASRVDAILLDSGRPNAAVRELGGTGRTHDWSISRRIVAGVSVPVFLAGGLNADNVAEAIATVRPYAIDVCSGVRTNGSLDPVKLERFVRAMA